MIKTRIGVVRGGPSSEYEISLRTGAAVLDALDKEKYEPLDIVISKAGVWHLHGLEIRPHEVAGRIDVIFNALHGYYGEDGKIQSLLEAHSIPFTGSDSLSSAIAMNKILAKEYFRRVGLKTPMYVSIEGGTAKKEINATEAYLLIHSKFPLPYIIKPISGGSSLGITLIKSRKDFTDALYKAFEIGDSVLVEEFIPGVEANVGVIEGFRGQRLYALPPVEIRKNKEKIFDYEMKYGGQSKEQRAKSKDEYKKETDNRSEKSDLVLGTRYLELSRSEEIVPATFPPSIKKELERLAMAAHEALGLAHYSRSDFIVSPHRGIFILETNSLPGLTNESLVPKELAAVGASLSNFVDHLITLALNE